MKSKLKLIAAILIISTATFGQKKVAKYYSIKNYSQDEAKSYFDRFDIDAIEGIWQSSDGFKYAIEKDVDNGMRSDEKYRVIILSHNTDSPFWKENFIKGFIQKTAVKGVFNIDYYTAGQNYSGKTDIEVQTCLGILESSSLFTFSMQSGEKILLIKLYPKTEANDSDNTYSSDVAQKSTGTGFALSSNGYIMTNHHVIDKANSIEVRGINGDFTKKYTAEVVVSDDKIDLAILKISDPLFTSLGNIPYTLQQSTSDVGENIFVLGYPLTITMGEEIKLTNGIISSKTGFQGDVSTYQISAPIQPGNSGGPMFDKNGNLTGIVSAKHLLAENAGYAIKINYAKNLMDLLPTKINFPTVNLLNGKTLSDQVKITSNYVYLIIINDNINSNNNESSKTTTPKKKSISEQNAAIYYKKSQELWQNKDLKGALEQINLSIESSSNYAGSYFFRGFIYLNGIRNFEKAVEDFTKSIQMQPDFEGAYFYRGMAYYDLKNNIEAIKDFTKVISFNKENTDAYFMRALIKSNLNDIQGAILDYNEIIKREKSAKPTIFNMATVYNNKAYCLVVLDKSNEALPFVTKALELDKSLWFIWDTRGEIYYKLGKYNEAIRDMNKAIEIEEHSNSYYIRGLSKIKLAQNESGCKDLSKAGELGEEKAYEAININCK